MTTTTMVTNRPASLVAPEQLIDGTWSVPDEPSVATSSASITRAVDSAWRDHRAAIDGIGTPQQRRSALGLAATRLDGLAESIAVQDTLNSGVPIAITRLFAGSLGAMLRDAADRIDSLAFDDLSNDGRDVRLHHLPLGPAAVLAPWNAPTVVAAKKAAFAWAAGCPVIIKPSPWSPNGTTLLVRAMHKAAVDAGLPAASVQLVFGGVAAGQTLAAAPHVRAISFTGSRAGGRAVAATAAGGVAALQLELGSNNPAIVLADADIPSTAAALSAGMSKLNGAWCESPGTVFVPQSIRDELLDSLVAELERLVIGNPLDETTTFGPQSNQVQADTLRARISQFEQAGAHVQTIGLVPQSDHWIAPTLVLDPPAELARDETFGPVLIIRTSNDLDEAIDETYRLSTGLAGFVFTRDKAMGQRIGRWLPTGEVKINGTSLLDMSDRSAQAFWYGSGIGGHGNAELLRFFTGARIVGEDIRSPL